MLKITKVHSSPYHPMGNRPAEAKVKIVKILKTALRTYCHVNPLKWSDYIAPIIAAINSTPNKSSTLSPFFINFGIKQPNAFDCIIIPNQQ